MLFNEKKKKLTPRQFDEEVKQLEQWVKESVSPFVGDTKKKQDARVRRARGDQDYFNTTYLPHYFNQDSPDFHREMEETAEEGERQHRPVAIAAPRGHAKTTRMTFARPLKKALYKEKKFIVLMGLDGGLAKGNTVSIRVELEHNPRIVHDFGAQKTGEWAADEFVTRGGTKVLARGSAQGIRGRKHGPHRPDLIIIDDPEDDEMQGNPERVKKLVANINEAYVPSLHPDYGQLFWVGTLLSTKSALATIMENPEWISRVYQAVENAEWHEEAVWDKARGIYLAAFTAGTPLWPERWSLEKLSRERRLIGSPSFNKEYQNAPEDDSKTFQRKWFRRIKWNALPNVALYPYAGRDPSLKEKRTSDFKAHVTAARGGVHIYILYASIKRFSIDRMIKEDYQLVPRFNVLRLGLETEGWQELLRSDYWREAERQGFHLPIVPIERHGISKDDDVRIGGLSPKVEGGIIIFAEGPASEVGDMELLIDQFVAFPTPRVHDDGPDAAEIAVNLADRRSTGKPSYESVGRREARFGAGAY